MNLEGKKVLVVGLARSGIAVARLLVSRGAKVDRQRHQTTESEIRETAAELRKRE